MNDARPSNWIRALRALLSAIVPIIAGLGAHAVVAQSDEADLALAIADDPDPVAVGGQLTYTITVTNNGTSDATNIVVVDDLPSGVIFESASLPPGTPSEGCGPDGPQVFCSIQALASGATATLTIVVTPTAANDQLRNMARVSGTDLTDVELTQVVSVLPTPPTASNVSISGTSQVGEVLTGSFTYFDADDDPEGASTFRWLRSPVGDDEVLNPIDGATDRPYTLVAADEGELIRFEVTPVAQTGPSPGVPVISDAVGPVTPAPNAPPTASSVSISGTPQVGELLTGSFTYADLENDREGASTFRWLRGDTPIDGATAPRYTLIAADQGALVRFEVTPVAQEGTSPGLAVRSAAVGPVAAPPNAPPVASAVRVTGTPQVGQVLTGGYTYSDTEGNPEGASTFRWLRGGTPIDGATAPTYILVAADQGATVSFEVTPVAQSGTSPGLAVTSAAVGPVAAALNDPPTASSVLISGTAQVGQVLTGSYTYSDTEADPEGVSTFRWLRGTAPIAGATSRTYTLVAADEGATVSFEVTPVAQSGTSPGRPIVSAAAGPVAPPINLPPTARNVLIIGVGQVLTGSYTYSDPENDPEGASIFRWLRDGTPIAGATAETYPLVVADQGAMVSFEVTPVAQSGTSLGLPVVSASGGPVTSALGRDRDDGPPFVCNGSRCLVPLKCNGVGTSCTAQVTLFALLPRARRLSDRPAVQAVRRIRFAAGVVNVPPGEIRTVRLRLTPGGKRIVNSGTRRILRGVLEIRNSPGGIQTTPIRLRIRVRR